MLRHRSRRLSEQALHEQQQDDHRHLYGDAVEDILKVEASHAGMMAGGG